VGDGQGFLGLGTSGMWLYDGMILGLFCVAVLLSAVAKVLWSRPSGPFMRGFVEKPTTYDAPRWRE